MILRIRYQPLLRLAKLQRPAQHDPLFRAAQSQTRTRALRAPLYAVTHCSLRSTFATTPPPPPPPSQDPRLEEPQISATVAATEALAIPTDPTLPPPKNKARLSSGRRWVIAAAFILLGTVGGSSLRLLVSPPPPPEPGTQQDGYTIELLHEQAAKLPVVKQLAADPAWESWEAYNTLSPDHKAQHIMAGTLAGSRGVGGFQRVFHNKSTGELVSVVFFGGATVGWPGVVHGGLLATILDESCGRAAFKHWGGMSGMTAKLELKYVRATLANGFYVVTARPRDEEQLPESERGKGHYKVFVDATIEDAATGKVTVVAEALFVGGEGKKKGKSGEAQWGGTGRDENARF
ncbi:HotDog domain-containing protein [Apodospora peruviana]|uniref:HotDog domain-containing protein n=1 Tax=Apodospora peruviana TaxID=516989 RepID=A0AAE0IU59_9PEZI|nr:HotDog domain-containing protein [Apodospora peruviana]